MNTVWIVTKDARQFDESMQMVIVGVFSNPRIAHAVVREYNAGDPSIRWQVEQDAHVVDLLTSWEKGTTYIAEIDFDGNQLPTENPTTLFRHPFNATASVFHNRVRGTSPLSADHALQAARATLKDHKRRDDPATTFSHGRMTP